MGARVPSELPGDIAQIKSDEDAATKLLWTRSDARDIALACRLAVEVERVASGAYNITGPRVVLEAETRELLARYCPSTEVREELVGSAAPLSCQKARRAFGYQPRYAWSEYTYHLEDNE